jgi:histidinol-phosphatase (PHP family)
MAPEIVSVHGGHSGQFCSHATDTLEAIVQRYIAKGFAWVGLTEHMPPTDEDFLYAEEREAGLDPGRMRERFDRYIAEARRLQSVYRDKIEILVGFETEAYSGGIQSIHRLINDVQPDYIVGSVHHVADIPFDMSHEAYGRAMETVGGFEDLYCSYFDLQYELIREVCPSVVGHFDLVRIFDSNYEAHLALPAVQTRIARNLQYIHQHNLILDYNVAALRKGASEPYLSKPILKQAVRMGIAVVPSDDSHSVDTVGAGIVEGIAILDQLGADTDWPKPRPLH